MINVVAAVIKNEDGKILITQRNLQKSQGGLWEFPGGKIEPNETKENAIVREIKEELDIDIEVEGGINGETAELAKEAGANILVAGNYLVTAENLKEAVQSLK